MIFIVGGAYQGKTEYAREYIEKGYRLIDEYHKQVEVELREGLNPIEEVEKLLASIDENTVIISNDMGNGLVPMDSFLREFREINGRVNCVLAKEATEVIRVICGVGTRIK